MAVTDIQSIAARIMLEQTCGACPEQYDAFLDGNKVGYLRLRHGAFRVNYPDCGDRTIYEASPDGDGIFADYERDYFLAEAKNAIAVAIIGPATPTEPTEYLIWSEEHRAWWAPHSLGYTNQMTKAGRYTAEQAAMIVRDANIGGWFNECAVPIDAHMRAILARAE